MTLASGSKEETEEIENQNLEMREDFCDVKMNSIEENVSVKEVVPADTAGLKDCFVGCCAYCL